MDAGKLSIPVEAQIDPFVQQMSELQEIAKKKGEEIGRAVQQGVTRAVTMPDSASYDAKWGNRFASLQQEIAKLPEAVRPPAEKAGGKAADGFADGFAKSMRTAMRAGIYIRAAAGALDMLTTASKIARSGDYDLMVQFQESIPIYGTLAKAIHGFADELMGVTEMSERVDAMLERTATMTANAVKEQGRFLGAVGSLTDRTIAAEQEQAMLAAPTERARIIERAKQALYNIERKFQMEMEAALTNQERMGLRDIRNLEISNVLRKQRNELDKEDARIQKEIGQEIADQIARSTANRQARDAAAQTNEDLFKDAASAIRAEAKRLRGITGAAFITARDTAIGSFSFGDQKAQAENIKRQTELLQKLVDLALKFGMSPQTVGFN